MSREKLSLQEISKSNGKSTKTLPTKIEQKQKAKFIRAPGYPTAELTHILEHGPGKLGTTIKNIQPKTTENLANQTRGVIPDEEGIYRGKWRNQLDHSTILTNIGTNMYCMPYIKRVISEYKNNKKMEPE